ncbi:MAG: YedE family putative selenium transporter, partial [Aminobacterium sp.]|nr:YedE family putative selenium transporter [Aminobacterium sp.]
MSRLGPIITGGVVGLLAALLVHWGNPGNMGICVACFTRDIAGALGLHRAAVVQYLRPEIAGFILGSFISALLYREYVPRSGSAPVIRFFLGMFAMIGALVFLGCPWRAYLRLAGGDWNSIAGIIGLIAGIGIGIAFLWKGFSLGRSYEAPKGTGLFMPLAAVALLVLVIMAPTFGKDGAAPIFFSEKGPGAAHAPI